MPRPKTPSPLQFLSMKTIVSTVVSACERQPNGQLDIQRYCQQLPTIMANQFVHHLLRTIWIRDLNKINIRGPLSITSCTHLNVDTDILSKHVAMQIVDNLDQMTGLTRLVVGRGDWNTASKVCQKLQHLPKMKSLHLQTEVTDGTLFQNLRFCPNLEELSFVWDMSTEHVTLNCPNLKRVSVIYHGQSIVTVMHILDSVPQLESLQVWKYMEQQLLESCSNTYFLKDLVGHNVIGNELVSLSTHFPNLDNLNVVKCDDPSPAGHMRCVKSLTVSDSSPLKMSMLTDLLAHSLVSLTLFDILGVRASFSYITSDCVKHVTELAIVECTDIDVLQIADVFPGLNSLVLSRNRMLPIQSVRHKMFSKLQQLLVTDIDTNVQSADLECMLSGCKKLQRLLVRCDSLDNRLIYKILRVNPMKQLEHFRVESINLTANVALVAFQFFGEYLEEFEILRCQMTLTQECLDQLRDKIRPYDLHIKIGDIRID